MVNNDPIKHPLSSFTVNPFLLSDRPLVPKSGSFSSALLWSEALRSQLIVGVVARSFGCVQRCAITLTVSSLLMIALVLSIYVLLFFGQFQKMWGFSFTFDSN